MSNGLFQSPTVHESLRRSEEQFRLLVEQVTDYAIFMLDASGHVITWNEGARRIKQYEADEIIGQHFSRFYTREDVRAGKPEHALKSAAEQGRYEELGWRVRKDGSRFWADVVITALRDEQGKLRGFAKITRDVSEQHRTELALRETEERFRLLVSQVKDYAIFMLNSDGTIASWNAGAERLKGYTEAEIIGKHFSIFYTPEDAQAGVPQRGVDAAARDGSYESLGWRRRKDGTLFWADVVITALHDPNGKLRGFAKVTRDFTKFREAEEALRQHADALARSNAELERYAYVASHDLQEPLRTVVSFSQLLQAQFGSQLPPKAQQYIQFCLDAATRMRELVKSLLSHARARTSELIIENVDTAAVLRNVLDDLTPLINESGAAISFGALPVVAADRRGLAQIFQNLISNAVKFRGEAPPKIEISAELSDSNWRFAVADNGIGIETKDTGRVFELFQRVHGRAELSGSGIGLAIVKQIVERLGGRIWVRSTPGKGSTFFFTMPPASARKVPV